MHSQVYGWVIQNLLTLGPGLDRQALREEVQVAMRELPGWLRAAVPCQTG